MGTHILTIADKSNTMVKGEITKLTKANIKSYSLRTTVPKGISKQFELKEGDSLYWQISPSSDKDKEMMIIVVPERGKRKVEK